MAFAVHALRVRVIVPALGFGRGHLACADTSETATCPTDTCTYGCAGAAVDRSTSERSDHRTGEHATRRRILLREVRRLTTDRVESVLTADAIVDAKLVECLRASGQGERARARWHRRAARQ
jgi:hypothetical protein